jgi:hypothetical protein
MTGMVELTERRDDGTHHGVYVRPKEVGSLRRLPPTDRHPAVTQVVTVRGLWVKVVEEPDEILTRMRAATGPSGKPKAGSEDAAGDSTKEG